MNYALVHSPLIGPGSWKPVADRLMDAGHDVLVPSLERALETDLIWEAQVEIISESVGDAEVWVVAHSGAGPLLPALTRALHVEGCIFVDAALPHPGRNRFEALPEDFVNRIRALEDDGWLPPWAEWFPRSYFEELLPDQSLRRTFLSDLPRLPIRLFEEPLPPIDLPPMPTAYIELSEAYAAEALQAEQKGWHVLLLQGDHLWPVTHPMEVGDAIVSAARGG